MAPQHSCLVQSQIVMVAHDGCADITAGVYKKANMSTQSSDIYAFSFHKCRNISSPEDDAAGRRVYSGSAPAKSILGLDDNENVRAYLVDAAGKQRHRPTLVHQAIRKTLREDPDVFGILNGGTVLVASSVKIDDKNNRLLLKDASIINGSQTHGELKRYFDKLSEGESEDEAANPSIKFEIIVTDDDDLIAEISIA